MAHIEEINLKDDDEFDPDVSQDLIEREDTHPMIYPPAIETTWSNPRAFFSNLLLFFGPAQMVAFGYVDRMLNLFS